MTFNEYQIKAQKTDIRQHYGQLNRRLVLSSWGLCEETEELLNAYLAWDILTSDSYLLDGFSTSDPSSVIKEAGDCLWYVQSILWELCIGELCVRQWDTISLYDEISITEAVAKIQQELKKLYRDDWGYLSIERRERFLSLFSSYLTKLETMLLEVGSSLTEAMELNIEKLYSRKERGVIQGDGDDR